MSERLTADERQAMRDRDTEYARTCERLAAMYADGVRDPNKFLKLGEQQHQLAIEQAADMLALLDAYAALLALVRRALPHLAFGVDESTPEVYALVRDMRAWVEAETE